MSSDVNSHVSSDVDSRMNSHVSVEEEVLGTRRGAGLFEMAHRGILEVRGGDRVRWLDGMISGDVQELEGGESGAGCYATLLTNRGAIVADLHVARIGDAYLMETLRSEVPRIREALLRFIIADDVELKDRSEDWTVLGLEGPGAAGLVEKVAGASAAGLAAECWSEASIAGCDVLIGAFGWSGEIGFQLRMQPGDRDTVEEGLKGAAGEGELVSGSFAAFEILRVEAGIPVLGAELDEEVLPPEARLERAIAINKGCYVGQEIVARLRARGKVNHLLVGLRLETEGLPEVGAELSAGERVTGELTSVVQSPTQGAIALGYVRREHAEDGTFVELAGGRARVSDLPFVEMSSGREAS